MKVERGAGHDVVYKMHKCLDKVQNGATVVQTLSVTQEGNMLRTNVFTFTLHNPSCKAVSS